jgi:hypothetical protein
VTRELRAAAAKAEADQQQSAGESETAQGGTLDVSLDEGFNAGNGANVQRRVPAGALIMAVVLVGSGASLWSMRALDKAAASGPKQNKEVEELVNKALGAKGSADAITTDAERLLEPTETAAEMRVPLASLAKNPFVIWAPASAPSAPDAPAEPTVDKRAEELAAWQTKVDEAAKIIKVQSTMSSGNGPQGATGIANINGHMMRIGDVFGVDGSEVEFTIEKIDRDSITARAFNPTLKHERVVQVNVLRKW